MVRFETIDGSIPVSEEWEDDDSSITLPILVPPDLSPQMMRLLSDCQAATAERIAQYLERYGNGRDVLIPVSKAVSRVRSNRWAQSNRLAR